jgi:integrase
MVRTTGRLTALRVERTKAPGMYADGGGLYLQVTEGGASWIYRYMLDGRAREMGLGPLALYVLSEARALAQEARKLRHQGIDPIEARRAAKVQKRLDASEAMTFQECAHAYIAAHRAGWRNGKHAAQWEATLATYAGPVIGGLPVRAIDTALVMKVINPLWVTKPETASRLRGRIERVLDWARVCGYRGGDNPARWRGHLDAVLPKQSKVSKVRNHPALPYADLPAFMLALRDREGIAAAALEFQILTASRPGNAVGARWSEIDLGAAVWTIAGEKMKGGKDHKVPLSAAALAVLERMEKIRSCEFVFFGADGKRPLSDAATGAVLDRMGHADIVPHGFRSSFRTWVGEKTSFQREVAEKALAHLVGDETERAYDRGNLFEKRRMLMDAWAAFASSDPERSADVLAFAPLATAN